jgi:hypothetical protein
MRFPLLGLTRDLHPLANAHAERTTKKEGDPKVLKGHPLCFYCIESVFSGYFFKKNIAIPLNFIGIAIVCLEIFYYLYTCKPKD